MTDNHDRIFFGSSAAISISSPSKAKPFVFLRCIKKKPSGQWERPTLGEGKTIRCSLEEMACMINVLEKRKEAWKTYHKYKGQSTTISFTWQDTGLFVSIGQYARKLQMGQIEVFRDLMKHLYAEKIEHATIAMKENGSGSNAEKTSEPRQESRIKEGRTGSLQIEKEPFDLEVMSEQETQEIRTPRFNSQASENKKQKTQWIRAFIERDTEKAILAKLQTGKEAWIPKSTIHSSFEKGKEQNILVDNWILKNNKILAGGVADE